MFLTFADRPADSPLIERVWHAHSVAGGVFHSMAEGNLELVVTRLPGVTRVTLRGPVTRASTVVCPPTGQWFAIRLRLGTYLPQLPTARLLDHNNLDLPLCSRQRFRFAKAAWEIPNFENAEIFVNRLAQRGIIAYDSAVGAALSGDPQALTQRSVQRHFLHVAGMTQSRFRQIERARQAVHLLRGGSSILDVVHGVGYFDQAHLTRSLKQLIGQTPLKLLRNQAQLSFLYKTEPVTYR
jgi:AraC-like DNA-binding protein